MFAWVFARGEPKDDVPSVFHWTSCFVRQGDDAKIRSAQQNGRPRRSVGMANRLRCLVYFEQLRTIHFDWREPV